jgi:hypothetical protein
VLDQLVIITNIISRRHASGRIDRGGDARAQRGGVVLAGRRDGV